MTAQTPGKPPRQPQPNQTDRTGPDTAHDAKEPRDETPAESLGHAIVEPVLGSRGTADERREADPRDDSAKKKH